MTMERIEQARATLRANDRGGYTVPTARLYPFQWNWDSAFVAIGFATFDEDRAFQEMESLLKAQWDNGLVPHVVFHAPSDDYFPGPDVWRTQQTLPSTGITQSPVLASAARAVFDMAKNREQAEARTAGIYPGLLRSHRWWRAARDPLGTGLVTTLHPWETSGDNSPAWDAPLARVPLETTTVIRRKDTGHVAADMRPRAEDYQRYIHLVDCYADAGWDPARMLAATPFRVADIGTNAILLRAERDLLALAARFGTPAERDEIAGRITALESGIARQWDAEAGIFRSRDLISDTPIRVGTSAGFLPLWAGAVTVAQAAAMAATLQHWQSQVRYGVPSTDPADPAFEPMRYWRGPIWSVMNWMIANGFAEQGHPDLAARIRTDTVTLVNETGFAEYFDPRDGAGLGGMDFTWTAAIHLLLAAS